MSLRTRILLARGVLYGGGMTLFIGLCFFNWLALIPASLWFLQRPRMIRYWLLPLLFARYRCPNNECGHIIELKQRWQLGDSYKHNRKAHVLAIHDDRGREVGKFECPRKSCRTTIQLQKGTKAKLVKGTILGGGSVSQSARPTAYNKDDLAFPIGIDRNARRKNILVRVFQRTFRIETDNRVYIPEEAYGRHMCIFGKSGMGKSTLILNQLQWMFEKGLGGTVIDPAGDLVDDILRLVPESRKDDVILIRVKDEQNPFRLNLLETYSRSEEMNLNYEMLSALRSVSRSWGEMIAYQMEVGIETAKQFDGSLKDVFDLFTKPSARYAAIAQLQDEELIEFWEKFDKQSNASKAPVIRKLRGLVKHKLLGPMLSADSSNFDPDATIRENKIVLVDLDTASTSEDIKIILGTFLIGKIRAAALRQPKEQRQRHFLIVDEAVDFMHEGMNFPKLFSQARKHKLSLVLASQHVTQMPDKVKESAFANSGVLISFNVDLDDAKLFASRMHEVSTEEITSQLRGECLARIGNVPYHVTTVLPLGIERTCSDYIVERMRLFGEVTPRSNGMINKSRPKSIVLDSLNKCNVKEVCEGVV